MQLSRRLQAVADLVTPGNIVADVGCDHAYTAIYLIKNNLSPHVIAMDVNQGPLKRATENIKRYGIEEGRIAIRRSNGLEKLKAGEADTILIAGMGGALMNEILLSPSEIACGAKELVLQPQSEIHLVRRMLWENDFIITKENMIKEDGKYYFMMRAIAKEDDKSIEAFHLNKEEEFYFGRLLLEERHPLLKEYLLRELRLCNQILKNLLSEGTEHARKRQQELSEKINMLENSLKLYKGEEGDNEYKRKDRD